MLAIPVRTGSRGEGSVTSDRESRGESPRANAEVKEKMDTKISRLAGQQPEGILETKLRRGFAVKFAIGFCIRGGGFVAEERRNRTAMEGQGQGIRCSKKGASPRQREKGDKTAERRHFQAGEVYFHCLCFFFSSLLVIA